MNAENTSGRRSGRAMPIILAGISVLSVLLGVGVGALMTLRSRSASAPPAPEVHAPPAAPKAETPPTIHSLGEMIVNLADVQQLRYAKLTVSAGFKDKIEEEEIKSFEPVLRDSVIQVVTKKRYSELHHVGGLDELREELRAEFCRRLPTHQVTEVYLEGFGMQ